MSAKQSKPAARKNEKPAPLLSAKSLDAIEDKIERADMYARFAAQSMRSLYEELDNSNEHVLGRLEALIEKSRALMSEALALLDGKKLAGEVRHD